LRARVLARLGAELHWSADRPRGATLSREAVEMARRLGEASTLAYALFMRHLAAWSLDNVEERLAIATEIVELAEQSQSQRQSIGAGSSAPATIGSSTCSSSARPARRTPRWSATTHWRRSCASITATRSWRSRRAR
jgi:hypothetical protein